MIQIIAFLIVCSIAEILPTLRPGAEWSLSGNTYSGLNWLDKSAPKPTSKEVTDAVANCRIAEQLRLQQQTQAKIDLNTSAKTDTQRIDAIITYLQLDK